MRHFAGIIVAILMAAGCAVAQSAEEGEAPAAQSAGGQVSAAPEASGVPEGASPVDADAVLDRLDALGERLTDFDADVTLTSVDPTFGSRTSRRGKVWYQSKPGGDARIRVGFATRALDDDDPTPDRVEYVLDNGWLVDRNYEKKVEVRRQVTAPGERINLLRLGEGPFPLPIGQDKAEVRKLFDVERKPLAADAPAGTTRLTLTPKPDTQFADKFASIDVWVDDATGMPRRIVTVDPRENESITTLENVRVNPGLADADFQLEAVSNWDVTTERFAD